MFYYQWKGLYSCSRGWLATLYEFVEAGDLIFLSPEMVACHEAVNW